MNRRKIYFIIVAFLILIIFYKADSGNTFKFEPEPKPITKNEILAKFHPDEDRKTNTNTAEIKYLFFPAFARTL